MRSVTSRPSSPVWRHAVVLVGLLGCSARALSPGEEPPDEPIVAAVVLDPPTPAPKPASAPPSADPTTTPSSPSAAKGAGHGQRCSGRAPADRPHEATCCYPGREALLGPLRATHEAMHACRVRSASPRPRGKLVLRLHVAPRGDVDEACADPSDVFDPTFTDCVLRAVRTASFPEQTREEERRCGSIRVVYPVTFAEEGAP